MQPGGGDMPKLGLLQQIEKDFGSFTNFREKFTEAALALFGSGWIWLVCKLPQKNIANVPYGFGCHACLLSSLAALYSNEKALVFGN